MKGEVRGDIRIAVPVATDPASEAHWKVRTMIRMIDIFEGLLKPSCYVRLRLEEVVFKVPEDIAVVGFSNEPFGEMIKPSLSSVDQLSKEIGHSVAQLFLDEVKDAQSDMKPKKIVLQPELRIRESSVRIK